MITNVKKPPPGEHPNSISHRWRPGESGNPRGRRAGVTFVSEYVNAYLIVDEDGAPRYSKADLERIAQDDGEAPAKKIAATWLLGCMKTGENWVVGKDGRLMPGRIDSEPGRERERLLDRMEGKPAVTVTHIRPPSPRPQELAEQLVGYLEANPQDIEALWPRILEMSRVSPVLRARVRPILKQHAPDLAAIIDPIEGVALPVIERDHPDLAAALEPVETTAVRGRRGGDRVNVIRR